MSLRRARLGPARKSRSPHVSILSSLTYQVELTRRYGLASCAIWWYEDVRHETMARPRYLAQVLLYCCTAKSEEHTSELQSRGHLVCRLLLYKKNATFTL